MTAWLQRSAGFFTIAACFATVRIATCREQVYVALAVAAVCAYVQGRSAGYYKGYISGRTDQL